MAVPRDRQPARGMPCAPDQGGRMLRHNLAAGGGAVVAGGNLTLVVVVAVIALLALAVAGWLVGAGLAARPGTGKMQGIARAPPGSAGACLRRQVRTPRRLRGIHFLVALVLPAATAG